MVRRVATPPATSLADWLRRIAAARDLADHQAAYDMVQAALADWPEALELEHQAILALARAGAHTAALARFASLETAGRLEAAPAALGAEFAGLAGRLHKDAAARAQGEAAQAHRLKAAAAYATGFERFGGHYLAVNAAAMFTAAGKPVIAHAYATQARARAQSHADYWAAVSGAEACLILGDVEAAAAHLKHAAGLGAARLADLATTRRQLAWLAALVEAPAGLLDHLPRPLVLSWLEAPAPAAITGRLAGQSVSATGPLLGPDDAALAAALLDAGVRELNLVLPCEPAGLDADMPALGAVLADARTRLITVTREGGVAEPAARYLAQCQARGLAVLRGQSLDAPPSLLAPDGTLGPLPVGLSDIPPASPPPGFPPDLVRQSRAIIFGDVRGFSQLGEAQQLLFLEHIIGGFGDLLHATAGMDYAETAGDGLYIVLADVLTAAQCALALRDALPGLAAQAGLPDLAIRLSAHAGPLFQRFDKVIGRQKFAGAEVIRTARIEPVTPPGEIYVTEQFAAALAAVSTAFICEYAGLQPMAKNFGTCRMYALRPLAFGGTIPAGPAHRA
jgi:hypothetical protein